MELSFRFFKSSIKKWLAFIPLFYKRLAVNLFCMKQQDSSIIYLALIVSDSITMFSAFEVRKWGWEGVEISLRDSAVGLIPETHRYKCHIKFNVLLEIQKLQMSVSHHLLYLSNVPLDT